MKILDAKTTPELAAGLFTMAEREMIQDRILEMARKDKRIVSAALVGGTAETGTDRWSDLDLTFGVSKDAKLEDVLRDWSAWFKQEFNVAQLFDLAASPAIYRVFLTPTNLQVDLSFAPEDQFVATGPRFKLLFGKFIERFQTLNPTPEHIFGLGIHHLVRARLSIERGRLWQAEYWISAARGEILTLISLERGLRLREGRGYDEIPSSILEPFRKTLVGSLDRASLLGALSALIDCFRKNSKSLGSRSSELEPQLKLLQRPSTN